MLKKVSHTLLVIALLSFVYGCNTAKKDAAHAALIDSLRTEYSSLLDSADRYWTVMIEDDDEKLLFMERLLKEVEYTQNYDRTVMDSLVSRVDEVKQMRYDRLSMGESALIDKYDAAAYDLSVDLIRYASEHPNYEQYPLMEELIEDIRKKDSDVLMLRVDYDQAARAYNSFVVDKKKYMSELDTSYVEKYPLFAIE
jgi:hypothetical protein